RSEMNVIARRLATAVYGYPRSSARMFASNPETGVAAVPLHDDTVGAVRPALLVIFCAVSCLLLIACLNLANLLGARAASRGREFAVRRALGASRARLAVQAMAEVAPVLAMGGTIGVAAAWWGIAAFLPFAPATLPRVESVGVNGPVLTFSVAM